MATMESTSKAELTIKSLKSRQIFIPILLGFAVVVYMFWGEFDHSGLKHIPLTMYTLLFIICAFCMMLTRDIGYIVRLKILSDGRLTWIQCVRIIFLWEFTSTITPSAVGGTSLAILFIYKEKVSLGHSSAMVMTTAFLDELYFLVMFPILLAAINTSELFSVQSSSEQGISWGNEFFYFAVIGYALKVVFVIIVAYALFINPLGFKRFLGRIFSIRFLKRWRRGAIQTGIDLQFASSELKTKGWRFWLSSFFATWIAWTSRYWVVNFLFIAFFTVPDHLLIFARQLVMWIMMLVSPTPGGSGFAEFIFSEFLGEYIPIVSLIPILVILWRLVTYYPYLIIGAFLVPIWIKKKFVSSKSQ